MTKTLFSVSDAATPQVSSTLCPRHGFEMISPLRCNRCSMLTLPSQATGNLLEHSSWAQNPGCGRNRLVQKHTADLFLHWLADKLIIPKPKLPLESKDNQYPSSLLSRTLVMTTGKAGDARTS